MLKDVNASLLKEEELERSRIRRYLQKPFYFARLKLTALFEALLGSSQTEASQIELTYEALRGEDTSLIALLKNTNQSWIESLIFTAASQTE